jgi:hypothetical protein
VHWHHCTLFCHTIGWLTWSTATMPWGQWLVCTIESSSQCTDTIVHCSVTQLAGSHGLLPPYHGLNGSPAQLCLPYSSVAPLHIAPSHNCLAGMVGALPPYNGLNGWPAQWGPPHSSVAPFHIAPGHNCLSSMVYCHHTMASMTGPHN